jgi:predicted signal transduction protein with EAL and GGDEF domain
MTWLWVNVPMMVLFVALWVGIPTWLVLKRPDKKPELASAAVRNLPDRLEARREDAAYRRAA